MTSKPFVERYRKFISWPPAVLIAVLAICSASRWEASHIDALLFAAGCILVGISAVGRLWCTLYIAGMKTKTLVTEGPYSLCRNPLYFFSMLGMLGVGLVTKTLTIPALLLVCFALYYPRVMRSEGVRMATLHGEDYVRYHERVNAFLPSRRAFTEPEKVLVDARKYRRAMTDVLWFVWLVGFFEIAEALRDVGILPTLFRLY